MKVLVTGSSGFIGSETVKTLLKRGHEVIALDRRTTPRAVPAGVEVMLGDIRDSTAIHEAVAHSEGVIHLGGVLGTQETVRQPYAAAETNILGGLNVLSSATHYKVPMVNIAVGNHWEQNTYSISKTTVERFCSMFRSYNDLEVTVVRGMNVIGRGQSVARPYGSSTVRKIMPSFACRAILGHPIEVYSDPELGSSIMDLIYIQNMAEILVQALEYTAENGAVETVIEAGPGRTLNVEQIAEIVKKFANSDSEIKLLPMRPGETPGAQVVAKPETLELINYDPSQLISLEEGLPDTIQYFTDYLRSTGQLAN